MHNIMKTERKYKYLIISHLRAWGWFLTPLGYIPNINSLLLLESMMLRSTLLDRKFRSYSFSSLHEFTSWHFTFNFVKFLSYSFRLVYWVKILWKTVSLFLLYFTSSHLIFLLQNDAPPRHEEKSEIIRNYCLAEYRSKSSVFSSHISVVCASYNWQLPTLKTSKTLISKWTNNNKHFNTETLFSCFLSRAFCCITANSYIHQVSGLREVPPFRRSTSH